MINNSQQLVKIIDFWNGTVLKDALFSRDIVKSIDTASKEIIDIIGPRRSGKSSILKLLIQKLKLKNAYLFINFEDPFFIDHNGPDIIEELILVYREYFDHELRYLFFDEIHVIKNWERALRKLRDSGDYKIFITGSSSNLLQSESSTLLTGRHLSTLVMPLSFKEFLSFLNIAIINKKDFILKSRKLLKNFDSYLAMGGFPEMVLTENQAILKQYFSDIVQKDIMVRYSIRQKDIINRLGIFLISNAAKIFSIESLKRTFGISYALTRTYLSYFEDAFLIFELPQFSYSLKTQQKSLKKIYTIDTGLANAVSFRFAEDKGRMLELCVFLELKRKYNTIYYCKTRRNTEVDFLINEHCKKQLVQVCWNFESQETHKREVANLAEAMDELKLKHALLLTYNQEKTIRLDGKIIQVMSVYRWLLQ